MRSIGSCHDSSSLPHPCVRSVLVDSAPPIPDRRGIVSHPSGLAARVGLRPPTPPYGGASSTPPLRSLIEGALSPAPLASRPEWGLGPSPLLTGEFRSHQCSPVHVSTHQYKPAPTSTRQCSPVLPSARPARSISLNRCGQATPPRATAWLHPQAVWQSALPVALWPRPFRWARPASRCGVVTPATLGQLRSRDYLALKAVAI